MGARRAVVRGKGGHRQEVVWASGTARLLPRYLSGRGRGPVFVTHRRPNVAPALVDVCPDTGRGRLSYQQAWKLFRRASGWTLHQLRHSSLTHLGEAGVGAPLLKAKSRHRSLRSLDRYVHPGARSGSGPHCAARSWASLPAAGSRGTTMIGAAPVSCSWVLRLGRVVVGW